MSAWGTRSRALGLVIALAMIGLLACQEQVRVKLKVRTRDSGVATSSTGPTR